MCGLYICELTYMEVGEKWRDYARVWSHVCIEGVEGIFRSNGWLSGDDLDVDERKIVFFHVSHRYTTRQYLIKENIRSVLPKDLVERAGDRGWRVSLAGCAKRWRRRSPWRRSRSRHSLRPAARW